MTAFVSAAKGLRSVVSVFDESVRVVGLVLIAVLVLGGLTTPDFLDLGNLSVVQRLSAAFGIVAVGEAIVILGKGIDLSVGAVAAFAPPAALQFMQDGASETTAVLLVLALVVIFGLFNGVLIAFVDVPALFVTLATGLLFVGGVKVMILDVNLYILPDGTQIENLGSGEIVGISTPVFVSAVVFVAAWLFLSFTAPGRLIRAMGDNYETARVGGAPVRPLQIGSYVVSALLACLAGFLLLARDGAVATVGSAFTPILFVALTVVIIGGVSLSGGRGTILGVLLGAEFIGLVTNLLTLNNLSPATQDLVRGLVLMLAVAADAWLHPRDEETAKSQDL